MQLLKSDSQHRNSNHQKINNNLKDIMVINLLADRYNRFVSVLTNSERSTLIMIECQTEMDNTRHFYYVQSIISTDSYGHLIGQ